MAMWRNVQAMASGGSRRCFALTIAGANLDYHIERGPPGQWREGAGAVAADHDLIADP